MPWGGSKFKAGKELTVARTAAAFPINQQRP